VVAQRRAVGRGGWRGSASLALSVGLLVVIDRVNRAVVVEGLEDVLAVDLTQAGRGENRVEAVPERARDGPA